MKKFVYLISPRKIGNHFYDDLKKVLAFKNVKFFQLRLKNHKKNEIIKIANNVKKITKRYGVKLIINDSAKIAKIVNADGCHLGQKDLSQFDKGSKSRKLNTIKYFSARLYLNWPKQKKIIGVTCHNSKLLAKIADENKVDYLAFGSFAKSKLKPKAKKADLNILKWAKKNIKKPIVAIGGVNNSNYKKLVNSGAKYIAISSFIWDNPKLKPELAIRKFK